MSRALTERPLTDEERRSLRSLSGFDWLTWLASQAGAFLFGALFISNVLPRWMDLSNRQMWQLIGGVCITWFIASIPLFRYLRNKSDTGGLARDGGDGLARVERFDAVDVIAFEEWEDLGDAYFVKLGDGSVLFLMGQYFYDEEEIAFPNTEFETVRTEAGGLLSFRVLGKRLAPSGVVCVFRPEVIRKGLPADGALVNIPWEDIRRRYGKEN